MRTISIIIFSIILLFPQAHAQAPVRIVVSGDTTIDVREALNLDEQENTFLYGEKVNGKQYGGDDKNRFKQNQIEPNKNAGIEIIRDNNGRIQVKMVFSEISDSCELKFKCANEDKPGNGNWLPDSGNTRLLVINKDNLSDGEYVPDEESAADENNVSADADAVEDESDDKQTGIVSSDNITRYGPYGIIILVLICAVVVAVRSIKQQIKRTKEDIYAKIGELSENISTLVGVGGSSGMNKDMYPDKQSVLTEEKIKRIVIDALDARLSASTFARKADFGQPTVDFEQKHDSFGASPLNNAGDTPSSSSSIDMDTDNVIYHEDQKCFSVGETDLKIFRIYSKNGEFYYTIVDNDDTRRTLSATVRSFESCLKLNNSKHNPKGVKPCKDGKLNKYGDKYYIDENNKLELEFV